MSIDSETLRITGRAAAYGTLYGTIGGVQIVCGVPMVIAALYTLGAIIITDLWVTRNRRKRGKDED